MMQRFTRDRVWPGGGWRCIRVRLWIVQASGWGMCADSREPLISTRADWWFLADLNRGLKLSHYTLNLMVSRTCSILKAHVNGGGISLLASTWNVSCLITSKPTKWLPLWTPTCCLSLLLKDRSKIRTVPNIIIIFLKQPLRCSLK